MSPYYVMVSRLLSLDVPVAIAHRGGSKLRPENTLPAFAHALALGVDAIECDVHLSADGEPVVIHDDRLERTTDRRGAVAALTARQLADTDAGANFVDLDGDRPYRGQGIGIPSLAEVLALSSDRPVVVELKGDDLCAVDRALDVIRNARADERVLVGGFSHAVLDRVRRVARCVTSASRIEVQSALRRSWFALAPRASGYAVFQVPVRLRGRTVLTRRFVHAARRTGLPVQAWIVDEPAEMRSLLAWGVTGLISDRPDLARAIVEEARRCANP